ncbi:MAG: YcjF family protein [Prochloraceae cyanobacterium]
MSFFRLLLSIVGLSFIIVLSIWLVTYIYRLYVEISLTSQLLATVLVVLLIILLTIIIGAFIYYFYLITKKNKPKREPIDPLKVSNPEDFIEAIKKQIDLVEDRTAKQALIDNLKELKNQIDRRELKVVIFGTGSAGKTSLVNALVGEMVGEVAATMGTTETGATYRLSLKGISRDILITDTPGINDAGIAGTQREELARKLATEADLLLFVIDNDLRESEYKPLQTLSEIGKRSLLVFNKIDLYAEEDIAEILSQLRAKVTDFIPAADVIAITANPQAIRLESGDIVKPDPEIMPLIKRLAAVLRAEGEDLIGDNILLQSQRLGEEARKLIDLQRQKQADKIIDRYQWISAGAIAVTPIPLIDMLVTAIINAQMVIEIGKIYGCELNGERAKELALSLGQTLLKLGIIKGVKELLLDRVLIRINVAAYVAGKAIDAVSAAYLTRIAGNSFIEYFSKDQDWGDGGISEVVDRQFKLSSRDEFIKGFIQEAISKAVTPFTDLWEKQQEDSRGSNLPK